MILSIPISSTSNRHHSLKLWNANYVKEQEHNPHARFAFSPKRQPFIKNKSFRKYTLPNAVYVRKEYELCFSPAKQWFYTIFYGFFPHTVSIVHTFQLNSLKRSISTNNIQSSIFVIKLKQNQHENWFCCNKRIIREIRAYLCYL